jgi:hypothetical protein
MTKRSPYLKQDIKLTSFPVKHVLEDRQKEIKEEKINVRNGKRCLTENGTEKQVPVGLQNDSSRCALFTRYMKIRPHGD